LDTLHSATSNFSWVASNTGGVDHVHVTFSGSSKISSACLRGSQWQCDWIFRQIPVDSGHPWLLLRI